MTREITGSAVSQATGGFRSVRFRGAECRSRRWLCKTNSATGDLLICSAPAMPSGRTPGSSRKGSDERADALSRPARLVTLTGCCPPLVPSPLEPRQQAGPVKPGQHWQEVKVLSHGWPPLAAAPRLLLLARAPARFDVGCRSQGRLRQSAKPPPASDRICPFWSSSGFLSRSSATA